MSKYHVSEFQLRVIIKIQSLWRSYIQRRVYKNMKKTIRERETTTRRLQYLNNKLQSKFTRTVLSAREKSKPSNSNVDIQKFINGDYVKVRVENSKSISEKTNFSQHNEEMNAQKNCSQQSYILANSNVGSALSSRPKMINLHSLKTEPTCVKEKLDRKLEINIQTVAPTKERLISSARNTQKQTINFEKYDRVLMEKTLRNNIPSKHLLLKQTKLLSWTKSNNYHAILTSGYQYYEVDVNIKDSFGNTPLYYAARNGNKEICEFLVNHSAYINEPCENGNTPLHMAFFSNQVMVSFIFMQVLTI